MVHRYWIVTNDIVPNHSGVPSSRYEVLIETCPAFQVGKWSLNANSSISLPFYYCALFYFSRLRRSGFACFSNLPVVTLTTHSCMRLKRAALWMSSKIGWSQHQQLTWWCWAEEITCEPPSTAHFHWKVIWQVVGHWVPSESLTSHSSSNLRKCCCHTLISRAATPNTTSVWMDSPTF